MRRLLSLLAAVVAMATAPAVASAQTTAGTAIPAPKPIATTIDQTPLIELSDGGGGLPYLGATASYNAGDWEPVLRQFHDSGVYGTELAQIDTIAQRRVIRVARAATKHAKLAIVLDIDETTLSNYSAISADDFTYGPASRAEATDEIGVAIQPTLALYQAAQRRNVAVFFITGRPEAQRQVTSENLVREGFTTWAGLSLKPAGTTLTTVAYKAGARAAIESQGYTIVANVGDQYSDLAGGHAQVAYKLPNPFYFLP
jgi:acid phosphatase